MSVAIYPGSFDPFTNGHLDIVKKASKLFDRVIIVIAVNPDKRRHYPANDVQMAIDATLKENHLSNCGVITWEGLIVDLMKRIKATYIVRGLRNTMDFNYEENIASVNKLLHPDMEYIYFRAENSAISSSMIRELVSHGVNVSNFVPAPIVKLIKGGQI